MGAVQQLIIELVERAQSGDLAARDELIRNGHLEFVAECYGPALRYAGELGWGLIPQAPETKKPLVKWKDFKDQQRPPSLAQLEQWWTRFPEAGINVLLGPTSSLFAIDVDGEEAHHVLTERLGSIPIAPRSGRGNQHRYHLFFRHPDEIATKARQTPWHPNLEFRGHGGYVVLPPSRHPSGNHYAWYPGLSPWSVPLPEVPPTVLEALQRIDADGKQPRRRAVVGHVAHAEQPVVVNALPGISVKTRQFLSGLFANGPAWNSRLFAAACDLHAHRVPIEKASILLMRGAQPWTDEERDKALATIESAFSEPRLPARLFGRQSRRRCPR